MSNTGKWIIFIFGLVIFSLLIGKTIESRIKIDKISINKNIAKPTIAQSKNEIVKVARVVDGDTIEIEGGEKVRYIGIDTPETVDPRKSVQCFGKEASDKNKELVEGKIVELEKDISNTDKYGRLLRYVRIDGAIINEVLVKEGYAKIDTVPPDVKYSRLFIAAEIEARTNSRGLWKKCR